MTTELSAQAGAEAGSAGGCSLRSLERPSSAPRCAGLAGQPTSWGAATVSTAMRKVVEKREVVSLVRVDARMYIGDGGKKRGRGRMEVFIYFFSFLFFVDLRERSLAVAGSRDMCVEAQSASRICGAMINSGYEASRWPVFRARDGSCACCFGRCCSCRKRAHACACCSCGARVPNGAACQAFVRGRAALLAQRIHATRGCAEALKSPPPLYKYHAPPPLNNSSLLTTFPPS